MKRDVKSKRVYYAAWGRCRVRAEWLYYYEGTTEKAGSQHLVFIKSPYERRKYAIIDAKTGYYVIKSLPKLRRETFLRLCTILTSPLDWAKAREGLPRISKRPLTKIEGE